MAQRFNRPFRWDFAESWGDLANLIDMDRRFTDRKRRQFQDEIMNWFAATDMNNSDLITDIQKELSNERKKKPNQSLEIQDHDLIGQFITNRKLYSLCATVHEFMNLFFKEQRRTFPLRLTNLIRELFEPHIVEIDSSWRSTAVVDLATSIDRHHDFTSMPILGDVLEEAGCRDDRILNHCRQSRNAHVPGCWLIDAVLGLE